MGDDKTELDPINSLDDLNERVKSFAHAFGDRPMWFRGQRNAEWHLHASIFRDRKHPVTGVLLSFDQKMEQEREVANTFRRRAPFRRESCPGDEDDFGWLALMRHYLTSCRLLDWSESALVALYHAVSEKMDKKRKTDSKMFFLDPARLNKQTMPGVYGSNGQVDGRPVTPNHMIVERRAKAAFEENPRIRKVDGVRTLEEAGREDKLNLIGPPLAVVPSENNNRMLVQSSVFTLHSNSKPLDDCGIEEPVVWSAVIPKSARGSLRETLNNLGINRNLLFPDLEDLANWLNEKVGLGEAVEEKDEETNEPST